ncbi:MAG: ANTAR domain-containing protein [Proteocatella sp.]
MEKIMIVSSTSRGHEMLAGILKTTPYSNIITANSASEAKRKMAEDNIAIIVINCPLSDEFGLELAQEIAEETSCAVALIVKSELSDQVEHRAEKFGAFVISKPLSRQVFCQSMKMLSATRKRMQGLQKENIKLKEKIEEIRLIDRAKHALIQYLSMSEPESHRYIEKQAMDMRISRREVARSILKIYEI